MAIIAAQTALNFAHGDYHRIIKAELVCAPTVERPHWHILVGHYASAYAREQNPQPMFTNVVDIYLDELEADPREGLYGLLLQNELFAGTNAVSDELTDEVVTEGDDQ